MRLHDNRLHGLTHIRNRLIRTGIERKYLSNRHSPREIQPGTLRTNPPVAVENHRNHRRFHDISQQKCPLVEPLHGTVT